MHIDSRFQILNMTAFAQFSRFLFYLPSLTWQAEASMDITVTVLGIKFKANNINFKKNSTLSGLSALPGVYTEYWNFFPNTTFSKDLPQVNLSANVFNPGTTSFIPLGDLRYEYFYASKNFTYENGTYAWGHLATAISPNASIVSGWTSVPTIASIAKPELPGYYYSTLGNLLQALINGDNNTEIVCVQTHNWDPCCNYTIPPIPPQMQRYYRSKGYPENLPLQLQEARRRSRVADDCVCVNASSIPLYNTFMQGLVLFMQLRLNAPAPLLTTISIATNTLTPGGSEPLTLTFINPFGVDIEIDSVTLNLTCNQTNIATYSAAGTLPHSKLVAVKAYSMATITPSAKAKFSQDSTQFINQLKGGQSVIGGTNGEVEFKLMNAPVLITYKQDSLTFLPGTS